MTIGTSIVGLPAVPSGIDSAGPASGAGGLALDLGVAVVVGLALVEAAGDGARIGGVDGRRGLRLRGVEGRRGVVLEMRQRRVLGMRGQPAVDQRLHELRAAQRAADEVVPA